MRPPLRAPSHTTIVTVGVGFTLIVGWGTTYLMPSVLGRHIQDDIGIPAEAALWLALAMAGLSLIAMIALARLAHFVR